jgi:hypothetical protein
MLTRNRDPGKQSCKHNQDISLWGEIERNFFETKGRIQRVIQVKRSRNRHPQIASSSLGQTWTLCVIFLGPMPSVLGPDLSIWRAQTDIVAQRGYG